MSLGSRFVSMMLSSSGTPRHQENILLGPSCPIINSRDDSDQSTFINTLVTHPVFIQTQLPYPTGTAETEVMGSPSIRPVYRAFNHRLATP